MKDDQSPVIQYVLDATITLDKPPKWSGNNDNNPTQAFENADVVVPGNTVDDAFAQKAGPQLIEQLNTKLNLSGFTSTYTPPKPNA